MLENGINPLPTMIHSNYPSPRVSIGFMTYNQLTRFDPKLFHDALHSLCEQDYVSKEIIISDDGSSDGTYEECLKYAEKYPFVKVYRHSKNIGPMENLESLFLHITGEYFLWACPDDTYAKDYLSKCVTLFNEEDKNQNLTTSETIMVVTGTRINYDNGDIRHFYYRDFQRDIPFRKRIRNVLQGRDALGNYLHYPPLIHTSLVKTSYIEKIYCRDQFFVVEEAWFLNALIWGKIGYIDDILYFRNDFSISYAIKMPSIGQQMDEKLGYLKNTLRSIKHFLSISGIPLRKRIRYGFFGLLVLRYRVYPKLKGYIKVCIVETLKKMGLKYGA